MSNTKLITKKHLLKLGWDYTDQELDLIADSLDKMLDERVGSLKLETKLEEAKRCLTLAEESPAVGESYEVEWAIQDRVNELEEQLRIKLST